MNKLELLYKNKFPVGNNIFLRQPTLREIIDYGEERYFFLVASLCSSLENFKWQISGDVDTDGIDSFDAFGIMCAGLSLEETRILFGECPLSEMKFALNRDTHERTLVAVKGMTFYTMSKREYFQMVEILKEMHCLNAPARHRFFWRRKRLDIGNALKRMVKCECTYDEFIDMPVCVWLSACDQVNALPAYREVMEEMAGKRKLLTDETAHKIGDIYDKIIKVNLDDSRMSPNEIDRKLVELCGVSLRDGMHIKKMGKLIQEVADVWKPLDKEKKVAIAELLGGKRRSADRISLYMLLENM